MVNTENIEDLVSRYEMLLKAGQKNPYYPLRSHWVKDIEIKKLELKRIINKGKT